MTHEMTKPVEQWIADLQVEGIDQAMRVYDWRYPANWGAEYAEYDLLLTGGKVITITASPEGARAIEAAAQAYGDDTLFLIGAKGRWSW